MKTDTLRRLARSAFAACALLAAPALAAEGEPSLGVDMSLWTVAPFALILLSIAVLPLVAHHWWERNRNKGIVAALLAAPVAAYLLIAHGAAGGHVLLEKLHEYTSFVALLGSLFVISGGIVVRGSLSGTPLVNTGILGIGALLASFIGTTGASVLLIRPLLRANASRKAKVHIVVFFIFVVSNCGGLLTPLGDPPLFLGFLQGVPFEWTLQLWKEWLVVNVALLVIFNVWDQRVLDKEELERPGAQLEDVQHHAPLRIVGTSNFVFLLGVVLAIYGSGTGLLNGGKPWPVGVQEAAMVLLAVAAWKTTKPALRAENRFSWGPIVEVAVLFAGIFVCMAPALLVLNAWGQGARTVGGVEFSMREPWQFFWATGALSSFLDNAPTYLTFAATTAGMHGIPVDQPRYLGALIETGEPATTLLVAISCGSVFMGANTYIGNGPNFMVKAIAEESGIKMPAFFGYMLYSGLVLLPLFGVVTYLFLL